jgi:hypothetical protein
MTGWPRIALFTVAALAAGALGPSLTPPAPVAPPGPPTPPVEPFRPPSAPAGDGAVPAVWAILPPATTAAPAAELVAAWAELPAGVAVVAATAGTPRLFVPPGTSPGAPPRSEGVGPDGGPVADLLELAVDTALSWRAPELVVWSPVLSPASLRRRLDTAEALQRAEAAGVRVRLVQPSAAQGGAR